MLFLDFFFRFFFSFFQKIFFISQRKNLKKKITANKTKPKYIQHGFCFTWFCLFLCIVSSLFLFRLPFIRYYSSDPWSSLFFFSFFFVLVLVSALDLIRWVGGFIHRLIFIDTMAQSMPYIVCITTRIESNWITHTMIQLLNLCSSIFFFSFILYYGFGGFFPYITIDNAK